jgi:hypothetical protein
LHAGSPQAEGRGSGLFAQGRAVPVGGWTGRCHLCEEREAQSAMRTALVQRVWSGLWAGRAFSDDAGLLRSQQQNRQPPDRAAHGPWCPRLRGSAPYPWVAAICPGPRHRYRFARQLPIPHSTAQYTTVHSSIAHPHATNPYRNAPICPSRLVYDGRRARLPRARLLVATPSTRPPRAHDRRARPAHIALPLPPQSPATWTSARTPFLGLTLALAL